MRTRPFVPASALALCAALTATASARAQTAPASAPPPATTEITPAGEPTATPSEAPPEAPTALSPGAMRDRANAAAALDARTAEQLGGPWSTPTLLVSPAGALPQWSVRGRIGTEYQSAIRARDPFRPTAAFSMGFGYGLTAHIQADWLGGATESTQAFGPSVAVSYQLFGARNGMGFLGSVSARLKWVGFSGRQPEVELAYAMQYRSRIFEAGMEAVVGQAVSIEERDAEARAYATVHFGDVFSAGLAGLWQVDLSPGTFDRGLNYTLRGGIIAAATYERFQVGLLLGASNFRLPTGDAVSPFGQAFVAYRFN